MPTVALANPPALGERAVYRDYKGWLLHHFFDHICAYCLLQDHGLQVEHYRPIGFDPSREHDPANLLTACDRCNGNGGKGDYHPDHANRRRMPRDESGYSVIDVRVDDLASLFRIEVDGRISVRPGPEGDRAGWNIVLLKLDLPMLRGCRKELLELRDACEDALTELANASNDVDKELWTRNVDRLARWFARRMPFFEILGLAMSEELRAIACSVREELRLGF